MNHREPGFDHRLHLDYETYSESDIRKEGAYKYARDPSTEVLMLGWAVDDGPVSLWIPGERNSTGDMPHDLAFHLQNPGTSVHAFNAAFERNITAHVLGIEVPIERWRCTMVEAYYLGFSGSLNSVLSAIGLPQKDARGDRLINVFSKPAPKNHKADRYTVAEKPREWEEFCQYCFKDVEVERNLWKWMRQFPTMRKWDWEQWFLDQRINDRGVPMDTDMGYSAQRVWDDEKQRLTDELLDLLPIEKATRGPFLEWLQGALGRKLEGLRKDYLTSLLDEIEDEKIRHVIGLWLQKEGKAVSKYAAAERGSCADGRARGMFQYKGASRTDRVGGRLIQLQNLRRPFLDTQEEIECVVKAIKAESPALLNMLYPHTVSDILGGSIRHMIRAEEGRTFAIGDLTSIESVVLGWIAQCPSVDATFRAGHDTYKVFASKYYGIPYDDVSKAQRTFCKPPVLGCGFMLGWKGLIDYAEGMGVEMSEDDSKKAVSTFRSMYPEIVTFWHWVYDAVKHVVRTRLSVEGYRLKIERDDHFLRIWLPSGRALSYFKPEIHRKRAPWSECEMTAKAEGVTYAAFIEAGWTDDSLIEHGYMEQVQFVDNFSYMGVHQKTNQWVRIFAHAGGVTENIVQSVAGDILWNGITNAEGSGLPVVLHVHDEIGVEVVEQSAEDSLGTLLSCLTTKPKWAESMWLGAAGYTGKRYTKD